MKFLTLDNCHNLRGKRVLVRIDINSPVSNGKIEDNERFRQHSETLRELANKGAKVVIISHQGRKGQSDFKSLKEHAVILSKYCHRKIMFIDDILGKRALEGIKGLKNGKILMLENLRYLKEENEEQKNYDNTNLVRTFSNYFDLFVFDAFSVSHRSTASVTGLGKNMITVAGRVMEKELRNLSKISHIAKPYIFILGGDKPNDLIDLIESKIRDVDFVLTGGVLGELCLMARGFDLGAKEGFLRYQGYTKMLPRIRKLVKSKKILTPVDFGLEKDNQRIELSIKYLPSRLMIYDIGHVTADNYSKIITRAKTIYLKGPVGHYERKNFEFGTKSILKSVVKSRAYSIVGGGHSLDSVIKYVGINKINYISLAGGALLEFLAGRKLPGVEMLLVKHRLFMDQ